MKLKDYRCTGNSNLSFDDVDTGASAHIKQMKDELLERTTENMERIAELQNRLFADGREGLVIALQGMDAAGKDSLIRHVMGAFNPQGVDVFSFRAPTTAELNHDFLWRIARCLPERGKISIFNRSHYEDVATVGVLKLYEHFTLPDRCLKGDFIAKRIEQVNQFEQYLYDNGTRVVKIFLNVSKKTQTKRMLERIDTPEKNWKFNPHDLDSRALWSQYQRAYEECINLTSTKHAPWYVIPADDKWFTRYLVSELLVDVLTRIDPCYPEPSTDLIARLPEYRNALTEK